MGAGTGWEIAQGVWTGGPKGTYELGGTVGAAGGGADGEDHETLSGAAGGAAEGADQVTLGGAAIAAAAFCWARRLFFFRNMRMTQYMNTVKITAWIWGKYQYGWHTSRFKSLRP